MQSTPCDHTEPIIPDHEMPAGITPAIRLVALTYLYSSRLRILDESQQYPLLC